MKAGLNPARLRTVHLVPLTAFTPDGKINAAVQAQHMRQMYEAGMRVFMPGAGTGEFHSLSATEIAEVIRITRDATGPDALIFAPVGFQIGHAIEVGLRAKDVGANGIMFMPFAHPYLCQPGVRDYYLQVMDRVQLPTLIYKKSSVPSDALLLELASHPWVVGIKYAENNLQDFRRTVLADQGRIEWLCGSAERFAPYYFLAGSTGYTSGAGNLCPHLTLAMHAAFTAGEFAQGMELQQHLLAIEDYRAKDGDSFNISMLKYSMQFAGLDFGTVRSPQRQIGDVDRADIERVVKAALHQEALLRDEMTTAGFGK